ncbi:MAG: DUF192 domain-containing protein [Candidatus Aminicenantes bacterium]|nr:MAG: DUF192 domain-containing protein [Candidatus Aminicenantes bacterium]
MIRKVILFIIFCGSLFSAAGSEIKIIPLYIGTEKFSVEIADTPRKIMKGMMFRESIPDDFGMLFVDEIEEYKGFWMKNCRVPLDIIYLDKNKQVINIHFNVPPCKREPCKIYQPKRPARYVLELRGNRAKELNLKPGDTVFFVLDH